MSTVYPDVNKYGTFDTKLCWAAVVSNALAWTGWNQAMAQASGTDVMDEWGIYDYFINHSENGQNDREWRILPAIQWILERHNVPVNYADVAQYRPAHDLFLSVPFLSSSERRCVSFDIYAYDEHYEKFGHGFTVYKTNRSLLSGYSENDPRSVEGFSFCDSDDATPETRFTFQGHQVKFDKYDVSSRHFKFVFDGEMWQLERWCSIAQYPGAVFT